MLSLSVFRTLRNASVCLTKTWTKTQWNQDDALQWPHWVEVSQLTVLSVIHCTLVCGISHVCKFMIQVFWELNYCIPSVECLDLVWKSASECMCTVVRHWWGGGDNSELPECHILSVTEERMCQRGYGSSVHSLSKSIKCKTKPKAEFMQCSVQSLKGSDCLRAAVKFFLLFLFYWENKN